MFDAIRESLKKLIKAGYADKELINTILKDIQRAMLLSDVDVKLAFEFTSRIKDKLKQEKHVSKEKIISMIYDELVKLVGEQGYKIDITEKPFKILLVGLFGSGKTTTAGKLAKFFKKRGFKVALLALDTFRPAAVEQLQQIGQSIDVPVLTKLGEKDPVGVIKSFNLEKYDIIIADSAGRDALDKELRDEISRIKSVLKPQEILLVMPADIGQNAKQQAEEFHKLLGITGIIVTKTDGTAKAGGALTACATTNAHIEFIGTGEKMSDLEEFDPKRYISRLLGMGDLETLLEKAKDLDKEKIETVGK
ncbi:MAG TPA: signal recognition particle protein Srp19, partial [Candidatus Aenigmarchaeota archaeon]|nr:signal recognition particle protein Srp19 [Candidatus Aenigmarchaeota archaeon]HEX32822.1 signal recognition particle protein Srp19 [Candidatus Aenigmarchaeota archaeon]